MDKDLELIYTQLVQRGGKTAGMNKEQFLQKLKTDDQYYNAVINYTKANALNVDAVIGVKKKEPTTPVPSSGGELPSSEPEKPQQSSVAPTQIPSILPPNYLKGATPAADGTRVVTPTPQQYQEIAKVKGYSKPQYTTKEMRAASNNLLQNQNKQQFFNQNPQATEFDYMRQQAEQNRQQSELNQKKALEVQQFGTKPDGGVNENYFGLKVEGNSVKFGTPQGSYVDPNEQLAVAVSISPLASKEFKAKFSENKGDIVEMFSYMPEQRKNQVKDLIRFGKYDEFEQASDLNNYYSSKTQLMSDDISVLKDRIKKAQVTQDKPLFDASASEIEQVYKDYDNQIQKNKELIGLFPKVAEEQTKELAKQAMYSTMNTINPETQFMANIGQGLVNAARTTFVTLPKSLLLFGANATDAVSGALTGDSVFSDDFKKLAAYSLDDISKKVEKLSTFTPEQQKDVYKWTQEISQVLGEMYFIYNKGASYATKLMNGSENAGLFTTAFLHSYGDSYIQGIKEYGLTPEESNMYASMIAIPQAALEGVFPDAKAFDWANKELSQNIITRVIRGKEPYKEVLKEYLGDIAKNTGEEVLQDIGANVGQNTFSLIADKPQLQKALVAQDDLLKTIGISVLTTGLASSPRLLQSQGIDNDSFNKGMVTLASVDDETLMGTMDRLVKDRIVDAGKAQELLSNVSYYKDALSKLPQDLKADTKIELVPLLLQKQGIEDTIKKMSDAIVNNNNSGIDPVILEVENGKIQKSIGDLEKQLQVVTDKIKNVYGAAESKEDEIAGFGTQPSNANDGGFVGGEERVVSEDSGRGESDNGIAEEVKPTTEPAEAETRQEKPVSEPLKDVEKIRDEAIGKFKKAGFDVLLGGVSETPYGKSAYFSIKRPDGTEQKVRVSDHQVENPDRIFGEIHISDKSADIDKAIQEAKNKIDEYNKKQEKRASDFDALKNKKQEIDSKWESIKDDFKGKYFHEINRTYMDMDKFKEKHPEAENIVQKDLGNGAFSYEWASNKSEYGKEKPSDYYIEQQETKTPTQSEQSKPKLKIPESAKKKLDKTFKKQKEDAIQESKSEESVLRQERPEMGLREVGQGDTENGKEAVKKEEEVKVKETKQKNNENGTVKTTTKRQRVIKQDSKVLQENPIVKTIRVGNRKSFKERKVRNPEQIKALSIKPSDSYQYVLQEFIKGAKLTREAVKKLVGEKNNNEIKSKIGLINSVDGFSTIDLFSHYLWENQEDVFGFEKYDTEELRDAIEDILRTHNSVSSMVKSMNESNSDKYTDEYLNEMAKYEKDYKELTDIFTDAELDIEDIDNTIDFYSTLTQDEIDSLRNISDDELYNTLLDEEQTYYEGEYEEPIIDINVKDVFPKLRKNSVAQSFKEGLNAKSIFEGGEVDPRDPMAIAAWRSMGEKEFIKLINGEEKGGNVAKKGDWFSDYPKRASEQIGENKYLVEFEGKKVSGETTTEKVDRKDVSAIWKSENGKWVRLNQDSDELKKIISESKESKPQETTFTYDKNGDIVEAEVVSKGKTTTSVIVDGKQTVRANSEVFSNKEDAQKRIEAEQQITENDQELISKAISLYYDMKDKTKTAKEKKEIKGEREKVLSENPELKRIFENIEKIHKQLTDKELITKEGDCP